MKFTFLESVGNLRHARPPAPPTPPSRQVKNGEVSGFHNWIMFYLEEKKGNVDYRGYIKPKSRDSTTAETNDDDRILTLQFRFK